MTPAPLPGLRRGARATNFVASYPPVTTAAGAAAPRGADQDWVLGALRLAEQEDLRVRVRGSGWSFSPAAIGEGLLLDLRALDQVAWLGEDAVARGDDAGSLLLVGPGTTLTRACAFAETHGRSLPVTNGRGGLTVVGALATGSHGSAIDLPPLGDHLVGIALATASNRVVWVEGSRPVLSEAWLRERGWERLADDDVLASAQVHLGCMGVVVAAVLQTEPAFDLDHHWQRPLLDARLRAFVGAPSSQRLSGPASTEPLYHANLVVNPHVKGPVHLSTAWRVPALSPPSRDDVPSGWLPPLGAVLTPLPRRCPEVVGPILDGLIAGATRPAHLRGRLGRIFPARVPRGYRPISQEIAVEGSRGEEALDTVLRILRDRPDGFAHPGFLAVRWMRGTRATLGFTRFARTTTFEFPTLHTPGVERTFARLAEALTPLGGAEHPGQVNHLDAATLRSSYGSRLDTWRAARARILGSNAGRFGSAWTDRLGLT